MSDDAIIDTIADVFARQETRFPGMLVSGRTVAGRILAALRERYAIVPRPEPPTGGYEHIVESGKKRYATVELPEPEPGEAAWPIDYPRQNATSWVFVTENSRIGFPPYRVDSSQARQLAAALLAAADAADKAEEGK